MTLGFYSSFLNGASAKAMKASFAAATTTTATKRSTIVKTVSPSILSIL